VGDDKLAWAVKLTDLGKAAADVALEEFGFGGYNPEEQKGLWKPGDPVMFLLLVLFID
jgi:hypothetical protein